MKTMRPINGNVVIEPSDRENTTAVGIVIPDTAQETRAEGTVIAVAADVPKNIAPGDRVLFREYAGKTVTFNGTEYTVVPFGDIHAKFAKGDEI